MRKFIVIFSIIIPLIVTAAATASLLIPQQSIYSQSIIEHDANSTTISNSASSNLSSLLKFENIKTIPDEIRVGEKFSINATVINTGSYPVTFIANLCDSKLYAMFDDKVGELNAPECKMVSEPVT